MYDEYSVQSMCSTIIEIIMAVGYVIYSIYLLVLINKKVSSQHQKLYYTCFAILLIITLLGEAAIDITIIMHEKANILYLYKLCSCACNVTFCSAVLTQSFVL